MITIINEKSSQMQNFAKALGGETGIIPSGTLKGEKYQIVCAAGHIFEFKPLKEMVPKDEVKNYVNWDYNVLPFDWHKISWRKQLKVHASGKGAQYYFDNFRASLGQSDKAIIATDNDESGEGDLLAWEIIDGANFHGQVYRCYHEDETKQNILKAFDNLKPVNHNDKQLRKAQGREKFDFLTIQYPCILTYFAGEKKCLPNDGVIRTGRLKAAMISLIGNQQSLHENFTPHSDFQPILTDEDGHKFIKKQAAFYNTKQEAEDKLDTVPQNAKSIKLSEKQVTTAPPEMLVLSLAISHLENKGFDSAKLTKTAEDMYRESYLSYPRPNKNVVTPEQVQQLIPLVPKICQVIQLDQNLLDLNNFRKNRYGKDSHGANRPGLKVPNNLSELNAKYGKEGVALYEIFARSFLSGFAKDKKAIRYTYADDQTKEYTATTTVTTDPGWKNVLKLDTDEQDKKENTDKFTEGQTLKPTVWEKKATRPSLATSMMLQRYLKHNNVGTDATRVTTYDNIIKKDKTRQLVIAKRGKLTLAKLGQLSYLGMSRTHLANIQMTKRLSQYLDDVGNGKLQESQVLDFLDTMLKQDKQTILANGKFYDKMPKYANHQHNKVGGVYQMTGQEVKFNDGWGDHKFSQDEIEQLLRGEDITFPYKDFKVTGKLADDKKYGFGFQGKPIFPKKPTWDGVYTATGEKVSINKKFGQHEFTQEEAQRLFNGETIAWSAKSKRGKSYTARVKLKKEKGFRDDTVKWRVDFADDFKKNTKKKHK